MAYTGHPSAGQPDTERPEEVPPTVEEKETETVREKANKMFRRFFGTRREARPIQKVEDAPLEEEQQRALPVRPPPTPRFVLPLGTRKPGLPTVEKVPDTERPEEKIAEKRPEKPSMAKEFTESVIKAIGPKKRVVTRVPRARVERDTEREFEETSVEKKPVPPDRSAEIWTESERAFRGVTTKIRETGMGFREEGKRKEDLYAKTVYHTVGLGLRYGASAVDVLSMPVRPILLMETALRAKKVVSKPVESIGEFGKAIMEDPLGVMADIGGGFLGAHIFGIATRRFGISRPSSYKLTQKTGYVTDISETPAFKMPRGKWRASWEITKKGGTAIVQLEKRKGLYSYWEPSPVYSSFSTVIPDLLGGLASIRGPDIDVVTKIDQQTREILMLGKTPKTKIWVEPQEILGETQVPEEKIGVFPQFRHRPISLTTTIQKPRIDLMEEQEQTETQVITSLITPISKFIMEEKQIKKRVFRRKRQPSDIAVISMSKLWGEERIYRVATRKKFEKALFGK